MSSEGGRKPFRPEEAGYRFARKNLPPISPKGYVHPAYGKYCGICKSKSKVRPTPGQYYADMPYTRSKSGKFLNSANFKVSNWTCDRCYDQLLPVTFKPPARR